MREEIVLSAGHPPDVSSAVRQRRIVLTLRSLTKLDCRGYDVVVHCMDLVGCDGDMRVFKDLRVDREGQLCKGRQVVDPPRSSSSAW